MKMDGPATTHSFLFSFHSLRPNPSSTSSSSPRSLSRAPPSIALASLRQLPLQNHTGFKYVNTSPDRADSIPSLLAEVTRCLTFTAIARTTGSAFQPHSSCKVSRPSGADRCWCDRPLVWKLTPTCNDSRVTACGLGLAACRTSEHVPFR